MARIKKSAGATGMVTSFPQRAAGAMKPQSAGGRGFSDRVETTDAALELSRAREQVRLVSEALSPRVEELKRQVESGEYEPDARQIAERLLDRGFRP
jgi:flagellar biosynthesis anti-sigma factor FlgM